MKNFLLVWPVVLAACSFYSDDKVLTDHPDADPSTDAAGRLGIDAVVTDGEFLACGEPTPCPAPMSGRATLCGQILDIETADSIATADSIEMRFYDTLAFAADPETAPLDVETVDVYDCGAFRAINVAVPFNRFIGVVVDDAGSPDDHWPAMVTRIVESNPVLTEVRAIAAARSTDEMWSSSAGNPFDAESFGDVGVYVGVFAHDGNLTSGVTITPGGALVPDDDFYFSDVTSTRTTVDPAQNATGSNGTALLVKSSLGQHRAEGGLPPECEWSSTLSAAVPGVIWFGEHHAILSDDSSKPCPAD